MTAKIENGQGRVEGHRVSSKGAEDRGQSLRGQNHREQMTKDQTTDDRERTAENVTGEPRRGLKRDNYFRFLDPKHEPVNPRRSIDAFLSGYQL